MPADFTTEQLVSLGNRESNRERDGGETQESLQSMNEGGLRVCVCVCGGWRWGERGGMCVMVVCLWYPQDGLFLWPEGSSYGDNW